MKALNVILDIIALLLFIALAIPVGYLLVIAAIFLGVEWWEFVLAGLAGAFMFWRLVRL